MNMPCLENKKLAIFDLDGTLVETQDINFMFYKKVFNSLGINIARDEWKQCFNNRKFEDGLEKFNKIKHSDADFLREFQTRENWKVEIVESNGLETNDMGVVLLKQAVKKGLKIVVCTTTRRKFAMMYLKKIEALDLVDLIISAEDVKKGKPNTECFEKISAATSSKYMDMILVDDDEASINAAQMLGIEGVLVK